MSTAPIPYAKKHVALEAMKAALEQLTLPDALEVTGQLIADLAISKTTKSPWPTPHATAAVFQRRRLGRPSPIATDHELESFILELKGPLTINDIRQACVKKFGAKRSPSKSALHRYIQKLKYRGNCQDSLERHQQSDLR